MIKRKLESEEDIYFLVESFYKKVRTDDILGSIFEKQISDWPAHMKVLTSFWKTNLLFELGYKGNPVKVHVEVDKSTDKNITQDHFGRWLQLWFETIDDHFVGQKATNAKDRARRMSTHLFIKMVMNRN